jgi:hypothetical protein
MTQSGTPSSARNSFRPASRRHRSGLRIRWLVALGPLFLVGCGGGWTSIPIESIDSETETLGSDRARLTLNDGRVLAFRLSRVEYPYLWGKRFLGENMPLREMRVDLREVMQIDIPSS